MNKSKKVTVLQEGLLIMVLFTISVYLYYLVAAWGISDYLSEGVFRNSVTGPEIHWEALILSLSFGLLFAVVNAWSDTPRMRRFPIGWIKKCFNHFKR